MRFHAVYDYLKVLLPEDIAVYEFNLAGSNQFKFGGLVLLAIEYFVLFLFIITCRCKIFLLREYHSPFVPLLHCIAKAADKRLYLVINHNVANYLEYEQLNSKYAPVITFIQFDLSETIPFPMPFLSLREKCVQEGRISVGLLGASRKEKGFKDILSAVRDFTPDTLKRIQPVVGSTFDPRCEGHLGVSKYNSISRVHFFY